MSVIHSLYSDTGTRQITWGFSSDEDSLPLSHPSSSTHSTHTLSSPCWEPGTWGLVPGPGGIPVGAQGGAAWAGAEVCTDMGFASPIPACDRAENGAAISFSQGQMHFTFLLLQRFFSWIIC